MSQINGIYNPSGLAKPFTMKAKLLMGAMKAKILMRQLRSVEGRSLDWNDDVPSNIKENWICLFQELAVNLS